MKAPAICVLLAILHVTVSAQSSSFFVGSTPCDSWIKSTLKIPEASPCEFQKWELKFEPGNLFSLQVRYGMSKPNTNGFQNDGTMIEIKGNYTVINPSPSSKKTVCLLSSPSLKSPLPLLKLDNNLFHILNDKKELLVGNGGFSYSLNRLNQ
jgi:hypothetical protein